MISVKGDQIFFSARTDDLEVGKVYKFRFETHYPDDTVVADEKRVKVVAPVERKIVGVKK